MFPVSEIVGEALAIIDSFHMKKDLKGLYQSRSYVIFRFPVLSRRFFLIFL
jgi:hypothetical protein